MNILILDDKMLLVKDTIRDINKILPDAECFGFHRESDALSFAETHPIDVFRESMDTLRLSPSTKNRSSGT